MVNILALVSRSFERMPLSGRQVVMNQRRGTLVACPFEGLVRRL
jgi:hypothetical protein